MHEPTLTLSDEQIDAVLDQRAHFGYVIADKRERMRMFARDILTYANSQQLAPAAQGDAAGMPPFLPVLVGLALLHLNSDWIVPKRESEFWEAWVAKQGFDPDLGLDEAATLDAIRNVLAWLDAARAQTQQGSAA